MKHLPSNVFGLDLLPLLARSLGGGGGVPDAGCWPVVPFRQRFDESVSFAQRKSCKRLTHARVRSVMMCLLAGTQP